MRFPFAALCICLAGCITNGGKSRPPTPEGTVTHEAQYALENGNLIFPPRETTHYECDSGKLSTWVSTSKLDTLYFEIDGDTLFLGLSFRETLASGTVAQGLERLKRNGAGSGIEGQWTDLNLPRVYRVLSGEPTVPEQAMLDRMSAAPNIDKRIGTRTFRFEDGTLKIYFDFESAEDFLAGWNGRDPESTAPPESATFAVSVGIVDKNTVELTGQKTGEKVRIYSTDPNIRTYTSNVSGHDSYTFDQSPETCPAKLWAPAWYDEFLQGNTKR
jgi:hypothetical protein